MAGEERVFRARVADFVGEAPYPATKDEVVARARRRNVASDVFEVLLRLPERRYSTLGEVQAEAARLLSRPVAG